MFQFNATTVINSTKDTSGKPLFAALTKSGSSTPDRFQIKRFHTFDKECIVNIFQVSPKDGVNGKLKIVVPPFATLGAGEYRLSFRVVPQDSNPHEYLNYTTYPGLPIDLDFIVSRPDEDVAKIADKIRKSLIKRLRMSENGLDFTFTNATGTDTIEFETKTPYFGFKGVTLSKFEPNCGDCPTNIGYRLIEKLDVPENFDLSTNTWESSDVMVGSTLTANEPAFGSYDHLLRTVNLPTDANYNFVSRTAYMRPAPGVKYTQFVIDYYKNRGILGHSAVGEDTDSLTQFSIWVAEGVVGDFVTALETVVTDKGPDKVWKEVTDLDTAREAISRVTGPTRSNQITIKESEE